jgi:hypothetical protein
MEIALCGFDFPARSKNPLLGGSFDHKFYN